MTANDKHSAGDPTVADVWGAWGEQVREYRRQHVEPVQRARRALRSMERRAYEQRLRERGMDDRSPGAVDLWLEVQREVRESEAGARLALVEAEEWLRLSRLDLARAEAEVEQLRARLAGGRAGLRLLGEGVTAS
jgi:hypothetical protein